MCYQQRSAHGHWPGQVWRYARQTGRVQVNIAEDLRGALAKHTKKHHAAVVTPEEFAPIVQAVKKYARRRPLHPAVIALQLVIMLFRRGKEIRLMRWEQIDFESATWACPGANIKGTKEQKLNSAPDLVPLPTQAIALLDSLRPSPDPDIEGWVFPQADSDKPIHENAMNLVLVSAGIPRTKTTVHGCRSTGRTILDEELGFDWRYLEAQLAHKHVGDPNRGAYIRTKYVEQRREMLQTWANYIDALAAGVEPKEAAKMVLK